MSVQPIFAHGVVTFGLPRSLVDCLGMGRQEPDWTAGAPKWAAVGVLALASVGALAYSAGRDRGAWRPIPAAAAVPVAPPVQAPGVPDAPALSVGTTPAAVATSPPAIRRNVNINTASAAELELLPGVGPALAQRIVEHRSRYGPFKRVDDLDAVRGIGSRLIERVRPVAAVE